ncbi:MAG: hypothetical protein AB9866_05700 [Syntrophobacteraceae bacterium]
MSKGMFNTSLPVQCAGCGASLQAAVFPALFRGTGPVDLGDSLYAEDEASCFYHPEKRAAVLCEGCGRFLCSLCEIPMAGGKLCPACVESGRNQGRLTELVTKRTLYDQIALSLAIWPLLLMFYITFITAPMAIYVALRYWKAPTSILPRSRIRSIAALILALLQVGGWTGILLYKYL